jgi:hypothetical protein
MSHIIRGSLRGLVCAKGASVPIHPATVLLYRARSERELPAAEEQRDPAALSADELAAKEQTLVGRAETDAQGGFTVRLERYDGGPLEIDLRFDRGPQGKGEGAEPLQLSLGTMRLEWQQGEQDSAATWRYVLPYRWWCWILKYFGIWVIWGRVVTCKTRLPLAGFKVRAYDTDIFPLLRDYLGSDTSAADGSFAIYFMASAFQKAPFGFAGELVKGPDYFFKVEDNNGTVVIDEPPSAGRAPGRENRSNCFCIELCVDVDGPGPYEQPWFTNVGNFQITTDTDANGLAKYARAGAGGTGWGFFGGLRLAGFCPKTSTANGLPMFYRFLFRNLTDGGTDQPVTAGMVLQQRVGSRLIPDGGGGWGFQQIWVDSFGATSPPPADPADPHVLVPDANGWIPVVQDALDNGYQDLLRLNSAAIVAGGGAPGNGPGNAVSSPRNGKLIEIVFQTTTDPAAGPEHEQAARAKLYVNNWEEVRLLSLQQFENPGATSCDELHDDLDVKYTVDHELLLSWGLGISSAASGLGWPGPGPLPPPPSGPRGGNGTRHLDISGWPSCSYTVGLSSTRKLTNGDTNDDTNGVHITFCK